MADTRVVLPACPCPMRARLRRLAPSYTFTGCLLPQAYGKSDTARNEDEYRVQASPTTPAKLLMLTQGMGRLKKRSEPLSYHIRNVPVFSTIEMSPGFGFMLPRKSGRVRLRKSLFSRDDSKLEEGCAVVSGMGARGKGQRPFPRSAL